MNLGNSEAGWVWSGASYAVRPAHQLPSQVRYAAFGHAKDPSQPEYAAPEVVLSLAHDWWAKPAEAPSCHVEDFWASPMPFDARVSPSNPTN